MMKQKKQTKRRRIGRVSSNNGIVTGKADIGLLAFFLLPVLGALATAVSDVPAIADNPVTEDADFEVVPPKQISGERLSDLHTIAACLAELNNHSSTWVRCMAQAAIGGKVEQAIREIYEQGRDNPALVRELIGADLLTKIESYQSTKL